MLVIGDRDCQEGRWNECKVGICCKDSFLPVP